MLSQDLHTIGGPDNSIISGAPTASSQNAEQPTVTTFMDGSIFSLARARGGTADASTSATGANLNPAAINQGRGSVIRRATTPREASTAVRGHGRKVYGLYQQDIIGLDGYSNHNLSTASPTPSQKRDSGRVWQSTTSALGKHRRAEQDLDETKQSRPRYFPKHEHEKSEAACAEDDGDDAHMGHGNDMFKAMQEQHSSRYHMTASILAREVISLRERVRNFEQEKEEALSKQRRQLRPGLVTMKMSPQVQERVNQLFGSTDIGTGSGQAWAGNLSPTPKTIRGGGMAISPWLEDVDDVTTHKDIGTTPTHSLLSDQETLATGPYFPPVGYFRHTTARKGSETLKSKNLSTKTSGNKSSKSKQSKGKMTRVDGDDSGEESDVPTESSWASSIPA